MSWSLGWIRGIDAGEQPRWSAYAPSRARKTNEKKPRRRFSVNASRLVDASRNHGESEPRRNHGAADVAAAAAARRRRVCPRRPRRQLRAMTATKSPTGGTAESTGVMRTIPRIVMRGEHTGTCTARTLLQLRARDAAMVTGNPDVGCPLANVSVFRQLVSYGDMPTVD